MKNLLDEPFDGSEDELKSLIRNFQDDQDEKKREVENVTFFFFLNEISRDKFLSFRLAGVKKASDEFDFQRVSFSFSSNRRKFHWNEN